MAALADLFGRHPGSDIYVVGSGVTLEHFDPEFFAGRIVIAINWVADRRPLPATYTLTKYHDIALALSAKYPDMGVVVSRHLHGNTAQPTISPERPNLYAFHHRANPSESFQAERDWPTEPGFLVNSHSSITSAMHLAALMGARNILMVGHDAGLLDGRMHFDGYRIEPDLRTNIGWLEGFERHSREVKAELVKRFGCRVYGLLPFINARMEGHEYP
jgi:hypothetical protein